MENVLRLFEAKELAEALRRSGHDVSDRTVQRWKASESSPKPQDMNAIWRILGQEPSQSTPPPWARELTEELKEEMRRLILGDDDDPDSLVARVLARLEAQLAAQSLPAGGLPGAGSGGDV